MSDRGATAERTLPTVPIPSLAHLRARVFLEVEDAKPVESSWGVYTRDAVIFECPATGTRFRNPVSRDEIEAFYEASYHERMTGTGDADPRPGYLEEGRLRARELQTHIPSGRVLDVGCSTGDFARVLRETGFDVLGSDISESACAAAREVLGGDRVFHGPVEQIDPSAIGQLDAITMMDVIEHLPDLMSPLRAMLALLRPGGVLYLRTPSLSSPFYAVADWSYRLTAGRFTTAVLKAYHAEHFYFFTESGLRTALEDAGFQVISARTDPLLWENFRSAEMNQGLLVNTALATVYAAGRLLGRGHGMKVVARRPKPDDAVATGASG